jgi:hypothetical protein
MMLRLLHAGSPENLPFFNGRQLPGTSCRAATIMLRGRGHVSPASWQNSQIHNGNLSKSADTRGKRLKLNITGKSFWKRN